MTLIDQNARRRALTAHAESLLVEAAAGTGKTAIMAGRCALLLAAGTAPKTIAAITFTELAAGELALRIRRMVEQLLRNDPPEELLFALPDGLSDAQRRNLASAHPQLDELTATTIHGFCQAIIRAFAVEADLDPGAAVMDGPQADVMFEGAFTDWLRRRLARDEAAAGAVGVLAGDDPLQVVDTVRELAKLRRRYPTAQPPDIDLSLRPDLAFRDAVDAFARWCASAPPEPRTADLVRELQVLEAFFSDALAGSYGFAALWRLAKPPRISTMLTRGLKWRNYNFRNAWRVAGGDAGVNLFETAQAHYEACRSAFGHLMGQLGGALVAFLSTELDELLADYAARKRAAAALDFDDLLLRARALVREHDNVRRALGRRYQHVFVDEFQDTDPIQAEVIFAIAAEELPAKWTDAVPRPGALFLVGDPKQAIYRFRGADVEAYAAVYEAFETRDPAAIIRLTANFRSAPEILEHVNSFFRAPLSIEGQPGYVELDTTLPASRGSLPGVCKLTLDVQAMSAARLRELEAQKVSDLCRRLVGSIEVRGRDGTYRPLRPGDIALLAPTGSELWRYEQALEDRRLAVASQAGKALMRRQETQDVLALLRTLADPADTLAFGAFLRGPMVGLTEERLLAVTAALPAPEDDRQRAFTLRTDPSSVFDTEARWVLEALQALRRRVGSTTPAALLGEAAEKLNLRVALALRTGDRGGRAIANLDALMTLAKAYRVRGLSAFVADLTADWKAGRPVTEGRIDESEEAISLVTMHSAKGLEWPVVIPINTGTQMRQLDQFVHRQKDNTLHWVLGGLTPPHLEAAQAEEAESAARERARLWYVACTRARDLLILPELNGADATSWARILDLGAGVLPELDPASLPVQPRPRTAVDANSQTSEIFAQQAAAVAAAAPPIVWRRPSDHDPDRADVQEVEIGEVIEDILEAPRVVGAGRVRGVLLHKLMEEMVTGELAGDPASVQARATVLAAELRTLESGEAVYPDPAECAETALRARALPEVAALWPMLEAELPIYAIDTDGVLVSGRADALALRDGRIEVILDWKSDLAPTAAERAAYSAQVAAYLRTTGASRGALVYLSRGEVSWVSPTE
ncbi:MAG: DNA helicase UvrD [Mesorhizobium sp.]|uniref:UvrD-helicase domain-containing protein n=1 Tax=unclassified Mesorhizobium TaxID=325217 RepID=UPI000F750EC3|nr:MULTISPECIES: UvrD-helicase domain-containing protein [unclassified Mesorhizobium]AZO34826.1 DNA helicase UvrD [Mesorhizobium sp. M2A.F.Ca.ET.046.03.2.1]RVC79840.1 DNA helicase UvrD [Mesorhizobium sp. M2A.F.Ca.ET.046.02.1.1]RWE19769.1 MAG: DNA helicase UvrD [Mesorhizobium sp.]